MELKENKAIKLGILVAVGLALFIWAIYFLGSQKNLFDSTITVKSYFSNVAGLVEGNKVRYSGITVGSVTEINIVSDSTILVELTVEEKSSKFIRKDSKVEISSDGLMGSKIVNILPGTTVAGSVSSEDVLAAVDPLDLQDILKNAKQAVDDSRMVTQNLIEITNKINNGNGDIAQLLNDDKIIRRVNLIGDQLEDAAFKINKITAKVENGEGDLGRLVNDTTLTTEFGNVLQKMNSIGTQADSISNEMLAFSKALNAGNGVISRLVYDKKMGNNLDTAIIKVDAGIEEVIDAAETIEKSWLFNLFSKNK